jgi:hypothetical protein
VSVSDRQAYVAIYRHTEEVQLSYFAKGTSCSAVASLISGVFNEASVYRSDRLCGPVVRVPGYITEMCCVSCEVRTEFIYVM